MWKYWTLVAATLLAIGCGSSFDSSLEPEGPSSDLPYVLDSTAGQIERNGEALTLTLTVQDEVVLIGEMGEGGQTTLAELARELEESELYAEFEYQAYGASKVLNFFPQSLEPLGDGTVRISGTTDDSVLTQEIGSGGELELFESGRLRLSELPPGRVQVEVTDQAGEQLPGVTVTASPTGSTPGAPRVSVTNANGRAQFSLNPGTYSVSTQLTGFSTQEQNIRVQLAQPLQLSFVLQFANP